MEGLLSKEHRMQKEGISQEKRVSSLKEIKIQVTLNLFFPKR